MPSRIEKEFMIEQGFLALSGFELLVGEVRVHLQTWEPEYKYISLPFSQAKLRSIDSVYDQNDTLDFPWDIIEFESNETVDGRWRFTLASDVVEIIFESAWPIVMES
jgi:hypothetical protein